MYKIKRPEIVLLQKNASGQMEEYKRFANENELVGFLARFHKPILSWDGHPIHGQFQNDYMDFQCLSGKQLEKGYRYCGGINIYVYNTFDKIWTPYLYQFYLDIPGHPFYDVRNLEKEVIKVYHEKQKEKLKHRTRMDMLEELKEQHRAKQWRKSHTYGTFGRLLNIRSIREEVGLTYDDYGYRQFAKAKILRFRKVWSSDYCGRRSNGWKDNSGNKYRKQWERGAVRKFKKEVKETQSK